MPDGVTSQGAVAGRLRPHESAGSYPPWPAYVIEAGQPPGAARDGDAVQRVKWLRRYLAPEAQWHAMLSATGAAGADEGEMAVLVLAGRVCGDLGWPREIASTAHRAEWEPALERVRGALKRIQWAVRAGLLRRDAPDELLAITRREARDVFLPSPVEKMLILRIARSLRQRHAR